MRFSSGIFSLFLLLLLPFGARAEDDCAGGYRLLVGGQAFHPHEFAAYLDTLDAKIKEELAAAPAEKPASLSRNYSYWKRMRNAELLWKGEKEFVAEIERLGTLSYNSNSEVTIGETSEEFLQRLISRVGINSNLKPMAKAIEQAQDEMRFHVGSSGMAKIKPRELEKNVLEFRRRVDAYRAKYGADLISEDAELNAAYNFAATDALLNIRGRALQNPRSLDAITLLAPLTDDALDKGIDVKSAMQKITAKLNGQKVHAETPYERIVFDFIDELMRDFPPERDPTLVEVLKELQKVQLQSVKLQRNPAVSPEDLLQVTNRKGGLAMLSFIKVGLKDLSPQETEYFYRLGTHAQKLDDFIDFSDDLAAGTTTLWTKSYREKNNLQEPISLLLRSLKMLDNSAADLLGAEGKSISDFVEFGTKAYVGGALLQPKLARLLAADFKGNFPLSPQHMRKMMETAFAKVADSDPDKKAVLDILQRNLLKGAGDRGSGLANLQGMPGYWQMMQLQHLYRMLHVKAARTQNGFALIALSKLGALTYITSQMHSEAMRATILPALIYMFVKNKFEHFDKLLLAAGTWLAYEKMMEQANTPPQPPKK